LPGKASQKKSDLNWDKMLTKELGEGAFGKHILNKRNQPHKIQAKRVLFQGIQRSVGQQEPEPTIIQGLTGGPLQSLRITNLAQGPQGGQKS
jgi:hypothetical protein